MKGNDYSNIGMFEGFNFREQSAIDRLLTPDEVLAWDHDEQGEAEFWPDGSNPFVQKLLNRNSCSASEVREVMRMFDEVEGSVHDLAKAVYLVDRGARLEQICRTAIDDSPLYVFGPGWFFELVEEAAYELFETFWPDAYKFWSEHNIPGLRFDFEEFMSSFSILEIKLAEGGFLVVDTE